MREEQDTMPGPEAVAPVSWKIKVPGFVAVVALILLLWWLLQEEGMPATLSASAVADWLNGLGYRGPLLLAAMMVIAVVVGPIPTLPISAASGLAFGMFAGTLVAATGALVGAMIAFHTARLLGRDVICRYVPGNPIFTTPQSQSVLFWAVFATRLIPVFSFALVSYAAGVTTIRSWQFALASFLGMLPMTVVFAGLGHTLEVHPALTISAAIALLLAMSILPYYLRHRLT
ncbi:MAG: TVP38/TMEM64 family protein [Pseudomonadota bacterium]